jgi:hypothetical protein
MRADRQICSIATGKGCAATPAIILQISFREAEGTMAAPRPARQFQVKIIAKIRAHFIA